MSNYKSSVLDVGLVLDSELTAYMNMQWLAGRSAISAPIAKMVRDGTFGEMAGTLSLPKAFYDPMTTIKGGALTVLHQFSGEYKTLDVLADEAVGGKGEPIEGSLDEDTLVYLPATRGVRLFGWEDKPGYNSPEEIISEYRQRLISFGFNLPEREINFIKRICLIVGSCG